ncbi:hypothetical protein DL768_003962 [Monosporascus sp. mg162]|nr:hypothetical protein DL768_003962 [Monosporascus sp. mg162]
MKLLLRVGRLVCRHLRGPRACGVRHAHQRRGCPTDGHPRTPSDGAWWPCARAAQAPWSASGCCGWTTGGIGFNVYRNDELLNSDILPGGTNDADVGKPQPLPCAGRWFD